MLSQQNNNADFSIKDHFCATTTAKIVLKIFTGFLNDVNLILNEFQIIC